MSLGVAALCLAIGAGQKATSAPAATDPLGRHDIVLGHSADGRRIDAIEIGDLDAPQRILVVGCIHGNEPAGIAIANRLAHTAPLHEVDLWLIPDLNPDGRAAGTRGNAHGVDLNRNFPWRWQHLTGVFYSGPMPLSEPESRIALRLIRRAKPQISIWFHQHMSLVDESGGSLAIERRFATLVGLPLARLTREPGSIVGWQNHTFPSATAFVVELPAGSLPRTDVRRYAQAVAVLGR